MLSDRTLSKEGKVEGVTVLATDITANSRRLRDLENENERYKQTMQQLSTQNGELKERQNTLTEANAELTQANAELTQANAELRSANEHLLVTPKTKA